MRLKSLGANRTELHLNSGAVVLFSYETPVAAHIPGGGFYRTECRWSRTTSKHIGQWLGEYDAKAEDRPQEFFDKLVRS